MRAAEMVEYLKTALAVCMALNFMLAGMVFWLVRALKVPGPQG